MPALVDLHSHLGYSDEVLNTERKENYTPENLLDHLDRYAYTGHALTMSLGSDPPAEFVWRTRTESIEGSFTGARFETVGRGLAWARNGPERDCPQRHPLSHYEQMASQTGESGSWRLAVSPLPRSGWRTDGDSQFPRRMPPARDELTREHGIPDVGEPARTDSGDC